MIKIRSLLKEDDFDLSFNPLSSKLNLPDNSSLVISQNDTGLEKISVVKGKPEDVAFEIFKKEIEKEVSKNRKQIDTLNLDIGDAIGLYRMEHTFKMEYSFDADVYFTVDKSNKYTDYYTVTTFDSYSAVIGSNSTFVPVIKPYIRSKNNIATAEDVDEVNRLIQHRSSDFDRVQEIDKYFFVRDASNYYKSKIKTK